jgi:hypothetical protein
MLSNILREKNFNVRQLFHAVHHKAHGHAFDFRVKVQCTLFYLKKFLITDYSKAICNAILGK